MKINIDTLDEVEFDKLTYTVEQYRISNRYQLGMDWEYFLDRINDLNQRLYELMPESQQRGLVFKITTQLGAIDPDQCDDATYITVHRGQNQWFITDVERLSPSEYDIIPVNLTQSMNRMKSILRTVTSVKSFNK